MNAIKGSMLAVAVLAVRVIVPGMACMRLGRSRPLPAPKAGD